ncbi:MAG: hypothetical protein HYZ47_02565 [Simkania negevensis]|nr:hypothetical protein [Simkania negevensis]
MTAECVAVHQDVSIHLRSDIEAYWGQNSLSQEEYLPLKAAEMVIQKSGNELMALLKTDSQALQAKTKEAIAVFRRHEHMAKEALAVVEQRENSTIQQWKQKKIEQGYGETSVNAVAQAKLAEIAARRGQVSEGLEGRKIEDKNR